ncbi:PQ-loop protein [Stachybotrys elegans]|uniref:PQ-loop protein n=1 Tax=Stachybotrys elegans TaxID=80388 RepID=A0A8K0WQS2_9HYPO|nr:PQ-loop protein [Stachybotrys elegans]
MASLLVTAAFAAASSDSAPVNAALSGVFGSISMTAWICLLIPQLIANYKAQRADGLSMAFLIVWLLGDATNLIGALFTRLAPTAVALASYFCVADVVLISQCVYYNTRNARRQKRAAAGLSEQSPLLAQHRNSSKPTEGEVDPTKSTESRDDIPDGSSWANNALSLVAVYVIGLCGWYVSYKAGAWGSEDPSAPEPHSTEKAPLEIVGLVLGYASAVCYLCARIPQIIKNYQEKSCEGLAILFFMLSLTGNLMYGLSLVAYSQDRDYLLKALPWLMGSVGTIVEDCIIFVQFRLYSNNPRSTVAQA